MSIPDYQTLMLPLLKSVADGKEYRISDLYESLSNEFGLSEEEKEERLPSGRETYIKNRIGWAKTYLKKAGLVESPEKGVIQITKTGSGILKKNPERIDNVFLRQFEGFVEFRPRNSDKEKSKIISAEETWEGTPEESFDSAYQDMRTELASELLDTIKLSSPYFFEQLVVDLMIAMGYGGSRKDAGEATKKSGDGGVDGVIREDRLGLDKIYLQAKRYTNGTVGEPELRDFAGALQKFRARKGVFITTSKFTKDASEYAEIIESNIVLIDGVRLTQLMIDYNVGVSTKEIYEIKNIDSDYFLG